MLKQKMSVLVVAVLAPMLIIFPSSAAAQASIYQTLNSPFYDPSSASCSTTVDVNLSGNDNAQKAFNFFISQGMTPAQSAGLVGNMMWESGLQPENIQNPGGSSPNPADAGSNGWGIVQWTPADTKVPGILRDANITTPVYELGTQLEMVWAQLTGKAGGYSEKQAGDDIRAATSVEDAVRAFQGDSKIGGKYSGFERPADEQATLNNRITLANQILQRFGGSSGTTVSTGSECSSVGPGQNTQYIDGFTVYSQYDPSWANLPYGNSTIADSGCGPSAMAMIITALTGQQVTPAQTAAYAGSQGLYVSGVGSSWNIGKVLAEHWSLKAAPIGADAAKITATLQSGGLVIAAGKGPDPFTTGGHFLVIRGVSADGNWMVGDSGHSDTSAKEWPANQILDSINANQSGGSVYAITQ